MKKFVFIFMPGVLAYKRPAPVFGKSMQEQQAQIVGLEKIINKR
jgi:hypothetical protein